MLKMNINARAKRPKIPKTRIRGTVSEGNFR